MYTDIIIFILRVVSIVQDFILNVINYYNELVFKFYSNQIMRIEYINMNDQHTTLYNVYMDPIFYIKMIFGMHNNKDILIYCIYKRVLEGNEGYLLIEHCNNDFKKFLLNLKLFDKDNLHYDDIKSLLENFIMYDIKNEIVHVEIDNKNITNEFLTYKNSYKLDNLKLSEILYCLNIIHGKIYDTKGFIKITDNEINEYVYESNKYINL